MAFIVAATIQALYEFGLRSLLYRIWFLQWLKSRQPDSMYSQISFDSLLYKVNKPETFIMSLLRLESTFKLEASILKLINTSPGKRRRIYSLSIQQICGLISGAVQPYLNNSIYSLSDEYIELLDIFIPHLSQVNLRYSSTKDLKSLGRLKQELAFQIERSVDDLQASMNILSTRSEYIISFLLVSILILIFQVQEFYSRGYFLSFTLYTLYYLIAAISGLLAPIIRRPLQK